MQAGKGYCQSVIITYVALLVSFTIQNHQHKLFGSARDSAVAW